ncbi:MAG TPA: ATP-grasp domain-containing protein [Ideonella sp.]|nr:ATP-grasp domain-containing protein [Ideonella sp.]
MTRVFVFEYLSGGGLIAGDADGKAADELMPLGCQMRDALVADLLATAGCSVTAATGERAPLPAALARAAAVQARPGEPLFDFVAAQAAAHDAAWVVAPETDGLLAHFHDLIGSARWLGCDHAAIVIAASKRATLERLAEAGLATPLAFEHSLLTTRWVVKPDDGAGGVATRLHTSASAALQDAAARGDATATVEPWVEGEPLSISLLCHDGTAELLSVNRQRILIGDQGHLFFDGVEVNTIPLASERGVALSALGRRVARALPGLRGFVGVDLVWHAERGPVAIEVNPRVTCAYAGLSASLGRNLAAELLSAHLREQADAVIA